jgi:hypothetical protein
MPLPEDTDVQWNIIFELALPNSYSAWRDARMFLLQDVLGYTYSSLPPPPETSNDIGLYSVLMSVFERVQSIKQPRLYPELLR